MTASETSIRGAYVRACYWMVLPAIVSHEGTHAAAAKLLGIPIVEFRWSPTRFPAVFLDGGGIAPWRIVLAWLAPTIVGIAAGLAFVVVVGSVPPTASGAVAILYWIVYSMPSRDDLRPLLAAVGVLKILD